jgi:hypothetical protein
MAAARIRRLSGAGDGSEKVALRHAMWRVLGEARDIRVDIQDMLETLDAIDEAAGHVDETLRQALLTEAFAVAQQRFKRSEPEISRRLKIIDEELDKNAELNDRISDHFEQVSNKWERAVDAWPATDAAQLADAPAKAKKVRPLLNQIIFLIGKASIPMRLERHLRQVDVGQPFNFEMAFKDELPDDASITTMLEYLTAHAAKVGGEINVEQRIIVRTSRSWRGIGLSLLAILSAAMLPFSLIALDRWFPNFDAKFFAEGAIPAIVDLYSFILVGAAAHFIIALIKNRNSGNPLVFMEQLRWINSKEGSIVLGVITLWVVTYGTWRILGDTNLGTGFFVGYSADSFVDVILQRFDTAINTTVPRLAKRFAPG